MNFYVACDEAVKVGTWKPLLINVSQNCKYAWEDEKFNLNLIKIMQRN